MKQIHLTENDIQNSIIKAIQETLDINDIAGIDAGDNEENTAEDVWSKAEDDYLMSEKLPKGWDKFENEDGETVYSDGDGNEYTKDEYGHLRPISDELYETKKAIKKMVKEALFVADNGITFDSSDGYENDWDQESLAEDAKEMLEMSDGMCDYNEWEDAFPDMDTDIKIDAWNQACQELGYDNLMVNYQMQEMRETVENLVRESINEIDMLNMLPQQYNYDQQEVKRSSIAKAKERAIKKSKETDTHRHNKMVKKNTKNDEKRSGKASKGKRSIVLGWLNDPSVNCAEIMRQLWNPNEDEEDAARSYFYKCRDGKLNDSGVPYKFSDSDINALYKIKSETSS